MAQTTEGASQVVESVRFSFMTEQDVRKHSLLKVTSPILLDNVERPVPGGLYDPILGPLDDRTPCKSCGQLGLGCPGHCGHIELVYPIYHPLLFNLLYNFLKRTCFFCHQFMVQSNEVERCVAQLKFIMKGDIVSAKQLESESGSTRTQSEYSDVSCESDVTIDSSKKCKDSGKEKQIWTSLQFAEVTAVMNKFLRSSSKECNNCKAKSPKLEKPTFGWVRLVCPLVIVHSRIKFCSPEVKFYGIFSPSSFIVKANKVLVRLDRISNSFDFQIDKSLELFGLDCSILDMMLGL